MSNITTIKNIFHIFFISFFLIAFISCTSTLDKPEPPKQNVTDNKIEKVEKVEKVEKKEEQPPQPAATNNKQNVPDAVYNKTFSDINDFILKLNKIISDLKFEEWKKHLTQDYIDYYSNTSNLNKISENPTLKKYKIVLRSLKDYFTYVVVPSRSEASLDSISFIDDNNVKAYTIIEGDPDPVILYNLVRINNNWKIEK
ncbi:MAG: hypothetical protein FWF38_05300 [Spirochaetaceae bacterium]|nr:hypothetical protein [Spirochaetaceae bacterium]